MQKKKDLVGKFGYVKTIERPSFTKDPVLDDKGKPTGAYNDVPNEDNLYYGDIVNVNENGDILMRQDSRGNIFFLLFEKDKIIYSGYKERTEEAKQKDKERFKGRKGKKSSKSDDSE